MIIYGTQKVKYAFQNQDHQFPLYMQVRTPPDNDDAFKKTPLLDSHMAPQQERLVKFCKAF